jgi:drug/metabolite transporter (DMT)-like permease
MKLMIGKALQKGPAGLTFAAVNSASVMPAIVIVFMIGSLIDYQLTPYDLAGSVLVLAGLFWAGWDKSAKPGTRAWIVFAAAAFFLHVFFLVLTECRAIFLNQHFSIENNFFNAEKMASEWFVPTIFAAAAGMHILLYCAAERRIPMKREVLWGILGGIFNGVCAFFFMRAAEMATVRETAYIIPIFSISLIIVCNFWGQWLYNEKVNWKANTLCLLGIFIAAYR